MLLKETGLLCSCDSNLLSALRKYNLKTTEDVLQTTSIKGRKQETMLSLQYAGFRDMICFLEEGKIPETEKYLQSRVQRDGEKTQVAGIEIGLNYQSFKISEMEYVLYRLGFNRRDTQIMRYLLDYYQVPTNSTVEKCLEAIDQIKELFPVSERGKCIFKKVRVLLDIEAKRKELSLTQKVYQLDKISL